MCRDLDKELLKALKETSPPRMYGIWGLGSRGYFTLDTGGREKAYSREEVVATLIRRRGDLEAKVGIIQTALDALHSSPKNGD